MQTIGVFVAALSALGCGGGNRSSGGKGGDMGAGDDAGAGSGGANIVFVLTDDLAWNLVPYMKNVQAMQHAGMTFTRYFVTDSLCCPSRSSIFTGKLPHDTQVFTNSGAQGGYAQFEKVGNPTQTFAVTLAAAGYKTAMMGKYLNGYTPKTNMADPGWSEWDVAGDGYPEFDYDLNENGTLVSFGDMATDYLVDVQSQLAQKFVQASAQGPFAIEIATFAPHAPYTPAPRYLGTSHEKAPRTPAFAVRNQNPPAWLAAQNTLTDADKAQIDIDFNKRVEAVQAVDDMIGALLSELAAAGHDKNTYVVFSSDNGYHMGEHMLYEGKQTAFDTDINLPLVVVGPGVPAGVTSDAIVQNIDLCPTFAELGGTNAPATADGHSLLALLQGQTPSDWRNVALVEHHGPEVEPRADDDPDNDDYAAVADGGAAPVHGPIPSSYEAIRMADSLFVSYGDGQTEYYDLASDPYQLDNRAATLTPAQVASFQSTVSAIANCHGAADCWKAQHR